MDRFGQGKRGGERMRIAAFRAVVPSPHAALAQAKISAVLLPAARMARGPDTPRTDARPVRPRMLAQPQISNFPQKTIFEARQIRDAEKAARCGKRHSARVN